MESELVDLSIGPIFMMIAHDEKDSRKFMIKLDILVDSIYAAAKLVMEAKYRFVLVQ